MHNDNIYSIRTSVCDIASSLAASALYFGTLISHLYLCIQTLTRKTRARKWTHARTHARTHTHTHTHTHTVFRNMLPPKTSSTGWWKQISKVWTHVTKALHSDFKTPHPLRTHSPSVLDNAVFIARSLAAFETIQHWHMKARSAWHKLQHLYTIVTTGES